MAEAGLYIPPSQFETWFLPITITDAEMEVLKDRIHKAFQSIN
jgi:glutamate-1-semialdehyde aminotransferase